jgi:hypothetical protein
MSEHKVVDVKLRAGGYMYPARLTYFGDKIIVKFGFNRNLIAEIKQMQGAKWNPGDKCWTISNTLRNSFQLDFLKGGNPYAPYDSPLVAVDTKRPLYDHQRVMVQHGLTRRYGILACEMGTGKSLAAIECVEHILPKATPDQVWYIGPKSGVYAFHCEMLKWKASFYPRMMTYEALTKYMKDNSLLKVPRCVIFDESSKIKTPTAQRSIAARILADEVHRVHGREGFVVLMSGTPAPRTPLDWWNQCLTGDTLVTTSTGIYRVDELINQRFFTSDTNGIYESSGFFVTDKSAQVFRIITEEGYTLRGTRNHRVLVDYDGFELWRQIDQLNRGDRLVLNRPNISWSGTGNACDGYILGLLYGDGNCYVKDTQVYGKLSFWPDDESIIPVIKNMLPGCKITGPNADGRMDCHDNRITQLVREWGVTPVKEINSSMMSASSDFLIGFIRGMVDSDGTIEHGRLRLSISQSDEKRIYALQQILIVFGIKSKITKKNAPLLPNIRGRKINTQVSYRLIIDGVDAKIYTKLIGCNNEYKSKALDLGVERSHKWPINHTATVLSVRYDGTETVYDCTVPVSNRFAANGIIVHNCETACPGFLKEGDYHKFKRNMCLVEMRPSITGSEYPHLLTWLDDDKKCKICGLLESDTKHNREALLLASLTGQNPAKLHKFEASVNEVARLHERLKGLVLVQFKKDCLDLPEKQYKVIELTPTPSMVRSMHLIRKTSRRVIEALTRIRELSDGFNYTETKVGDQICGGCNGKKIVTRPDQQSDGSFSSIAAPCDYCGGRGIIDRTERTVTEVPTPKDDFLRDLLDEYEDIGRCIIWAGYTGSIDKITALCLKEGWDVIQVDGRGFIGKTSDGGRPDPKLLLQAMDGSNPMRKELEKTFPKLAFVGHPRAGGMALTLTASPVEIFYSNDFNGEARFQAEDRFHRAGMDMNRGATIIDLFLLPTDKLVLENLRKKRDLQSMTLGELDAVIGEIK